MIYNTIGRQVQLSNSQTYYRKQMELLIVECVAKGEPFIRKWKKLLPIRHTISEKQMNGRCRSYG